MLICFIGNFFSSSFSFLSFVESSFSFDFSIWSLREVLSCSKASTELVSSKTLSVLPKDGNPRVIAPLAASPVSVFLALDPACFFAGFLFCEMSLSVVGSSRRAPCLAGWEDRAKEPNEKEGRIVLLGGSVSLVQVDTAVECDGIVGSDFPLCCTSVGARASAGLGVHEEGSCMAALHMFDQEVLVP